MHLADLLDLLASLGPVRTLAQDQGLLEPLAIIMSSCFQGAPHDSSREGLRVVFETLAGALLPSSGSRPGEAAESEGPHPLLHFIVSMFARRDLAR